MEGGKAESGPAHRRVNKDRGRKQAAVKLVTVVVVAVVVVKGVGAPAHLARLAPSREDAKRGRDAAVTP